jgi:hypothetical protein
MTKNTTPSRPTHRVYAVIKREGRDKAHWTEIGAAWPHSDGDGFNLRLNYLPLNGAELVIRKPKAQGAQGGAS